jgi:hypothetical protein
MSITFWTYLLVTFHIERHQSNLSANISSEAAVPNVRLFRITVGGKVNRNEAR